MFYGGKYNDFHDWMNKNHLILRIIASKFGQIIGNCYICSKFNTHSIIDL